MIVLACLSAAACQAAPTGQIPAGWHTYSDARGFAISYPADWKADPRFADLDYPDNDGNRAKIEGLGVTPTTELQPGTTLQGKQVTLAVEVLPSFRPGCAAANFLAQQPPDYNSGIDEQTQVYAHQSGGDPGGWYSYEDFVYLVSMKPCRAIHYFISYATPDGEPAQGVSPFDRKKLLKLLDRIRATFAPGHR
ncbi:MAG TPA: hypothetical protein VIJ72_03960 [Rhizomicrobium sp.]